MRWSGGGSSPLRAGPMPGKQFVDSVDRVVGDAGEDIAQISLGIEAVQGGGLDQGVEDRCAATPASEPTNR